MRLTCHFVTLVAVALCGVPVAAVAQSETIVVTGKAVSRDEAREASKQFVRGVSAIPVAGQFARWRDAICPKTIGLSAANAAIVTDKIRKIARDADVRVGKAKCKTNLLVIFTADGDRDIADIKKRRLRQFAKLDPVERRLLNETDRPARWWYATGFEGADGHAPGVPTALLTAQVEVPGGVALSGGISGSEDQQDISSYNSSLIGSRIRAKIEQAVIIIDANAASGRTLKSVAAYAAFVTLARIRMDGAALADASILRLFSGDAAPPDDLTARDAAFLSALYRAPANREARYQSGAIATIMARLLVPDDRP